jgi:hypothetical protein
MELYCESNSLAHIAHIFRGVLPTVKGIRMEKKGRNLPRESYIVLVIVPVSS